VAEEIQLDLVDASCGGASTTSITGRQLTVLRQHVPPQIDRLGPDTDLVTLSIGGNDFGLYSVVSTICVAIAEQSPTGRPCSEANRKAGELAVEPKLEQLSGRIAKVLAEIEERAPEAEIIVVGYPAFAPAKDPCALLPLAEGDVPLAHRINLGLNDALATAADEAGVTYLDVYEATRGHDMCSDDPWIAGKRAVGDRAAPWHPYFQEQKVVADLILEAIGRP
jgi:lysophospholipase L1-like esterase